MPNRRSPAENRRRAAGGAGRYLRRQVGKREPLQRFLIVCEGTRTEPNYFLAFRLPRDVVTVDVRGRGFNTISLVEEADRLARLDDDYDQVWCVFDRDQFPVQQFNEALARARQLGFRIAYSNEAFELWFLLHFDYVGAGLTRGQYCQKLSQRLGIEYRKNSKEMYSLLEQQQAQALRNAKLLMSQYQQLDPANDNPSTTVHLLVEQLNRFIR